MNSIANENTETESDESFGYEFGVDGLMNAKEACEHLGNISRQTLILHVQSGLVRKGNLPSPGGPGKAVYCARSVREFARSLENK